MKHQLRGIIGQDDAQTHIEHKFDVSPDAKLIRIEFDYSPKWPETGDIPHEISLSLFDPETGRGARHNNPDHAIRIAETCASPGYLAGPLTPGAWTLSIDVHRLMPPEGVRYDLSIEVLDSCDETHVDEYSPAALPDKGPGWYRGDLHGHSLHSDADWTVKDFVNYARGIGLDFVTLTDHNTISGVPEARSYGDEDLLVMGGVELTTFWGHCLSIGADRIVDWRGPRPGLMPEIAADVAKAGGAYIIAHPTNFGLPYCSGCDWKYGDMMPGNALGVEIWNSGWNGPANNPVAQNLYYRWLSQGRRLVATAGSDIHGPFGSDQRPGYNMVRAEALRERDILDAIIAGHLYITSGPLLGLSAIQSSRKAMMGDVLDCETAMLQIDWDTGSENVVAQLVRKSGNASSVETLRKLDGTRGHVELSFEPGGEFDWVVLEARDATGALHAMTNPIYFGTQTPCSLTSFGRFV